MTDKTITRYNEAGSYIINTSQENLRVMKELLECIQNFGSNIQKIVDSLGKLEIIKEHDPKANLQFHNFWVNLAEFDLNPTTNFIFLSQATLLQATVGMNNVISDYEKRSEKIVSKLVQFIKKWKTIYKAAKDAKENYEKAGKAVQEAYNTKSNRLDLCKEEFLKIQAATIETYNSTNHERSNLSTDIEKCLNEFEENEKDRIASLKNVFLTLANDIKKTGELFISSSGSIYHSLNAANLAKDTATITECSNLKNAEASSRYQLIGVPSIASKFLNEEKIWKKEISNGFKVAICINDYHSTLPDHLDIKKGEKVLVVSDKGEFKLCRNINDSIGLIPSKNLQ